MKIIAKYKMKKPSEAAQIKRFDMNIRPNKCRWYLKPVTWIAALPENIQTGAKVRKHNMKGVKPPYILLANHNAFIDFKLSTKAIFPHSAVYVVSVDGFIGREGIMRKAGCFPKRKFINDPGLVKHIKHVLHKEKTIFGLYPEARYSFVGTNHVLPPSMGKLVKMMNVPIVMLIAHAHHLRHPLWDQLAKRKVKTSGDMTLIITAEETQTLTVEEINDRIEKAFQYDDYKWQYDHKMHIKENYRARGLHHVLYKCPNCQTEYEMEGKGTTLTCHHCGKVWNMTTLGRMEAVEGETEFPHIPDWFEWERACVRKEVEAETYNVDIPVTIELLPNSEGYVRFGEGRLTHNKDGFKITGEWGDEKFELIKAVADNYSVHVEFNYAFSKGNLISLSTGSDSYFFFIKEPKDYATKIQFAVEELYKHYIVNQKQ